MNRFCLLLPKIRKNIVGVVSLLSICACAMSDITPNDEGIRGADDSASIQNAVDAAAKRGTGKVVIPAWNVRTGKPGWTFSRSVLPTRACSSDKVAANSRRNPAPRRRGRPASGMPLTH